MKNLANEIRTSINKNGGLNSFSSQIRKNRSLGCPMKRMIIEGLQDLSKEELHVAFHLGLIGNNAKNGSIVNNSKVKESKYKLLLNIFKEWLWIDKFLFTIKPMWL